MSKVGDAYADVKICMLGTLACNEDRYPGEPMPGVAADPAMLAALQTEAWCKENPLAEVVATVSDNGEGGEGLWLTFGLEYVTPPPDGSDGDNCDIFTIRLSAQQALALAGALRAAVDMRAATGDDGK